MLAMLACWRHYADAAQVIDPWASTRADESAKIPVSPDVSIANDISGCQTGSQRQDSRGHDRLEVPAALDSAEERERPQEKQQAAEDVEREEVEPDRRCHGRIVAGRLAPP